jgi:hypothetical protein
MAHWAELDENNIVLQVTVGDNNDPDEGYQWLIDNLGGTWIKTSYNAIAGKRRNPETNEILNEPGFRKNYAGIGFTYNPVLDAFIPPKPEIGEWTLHEASCTWIINKPFPSWTFNEETLSWQPPTTYPTDGGIYQWVEDDLNWQLVESGA